MEKHEKMKNVQTSCKINKFHEKNQSEKSLLKNSRLFKNIFACKKSRIWGAYIKIKNKHVGMRQSFIKVAPQRYNAIIIASQKNPLRPLGGPFSAVRGS